MVGIGGKGGGEETEKKNVREEKRKEREKTSIGRASVREDRVGEASARRPGRTSRGSYDAAAVDVEIDPQSCRFRGLLLLFITAGPSKSCKAVRGRRVKRVLWDHDATSRGRLCGRVGPPRTNGRVTWANRERGQSR